MTMQALVDLPAEVLGRQVVSDEGRAHRPSKLLQRPERRVLRSTAAERRSTCSASAAPRRRAVAYFYELVVETHSLEDVFFELTAGEANDARVG